MESELLHLGEIANKTTLETIKEVLETHLCRDVVNMILAPRIARPERKYQKKLAKLGRKEKYQQKVQKLLERDRRRRERSEFYARKRNEDYILKQRVLNAPMLRRVWIEDGIFCYQAFPILSEKDFEDTIKIPLRPIEIVQWKGEVIRKTPMPDKTFHELLSFVGGCNQFADGDICYGI